MKVMMPNRNERKNDEGSIALMAIVIMITTGLVLAMLLVAERGMWASRRAGDSANALQVADAGVNAAVQLIPTVPATQNAVGPVTATVGDGTFTFSATKVDDQTWNVSSVGADKSGMKRRVVAQAVAQPLFGRPIYVRATANLKAGNVLDSYKSASERCTGQGVMTVDSPGQLSFTGQGNQANCTKSLATDPKDWVYGIDGCDIPGDDAKLSEPVPYKNDDNKEIIESSRCPPEPKDLPAGIKDRAESFGTKRVAPKLSPQAVVPPKASQIDYPIASEVRPGTSLECNASKPLQSGKVYYYDTIYLRDGCYIAGVPATLTTKSKPTSLFANNIEVGIKQGSNGVVNAPQAPACKQWDSDPNSSGYCSLWVAHLQLNVIGAGKITLMNNLRFFWGVINASEGQVINEAQQLEAWGASVSNSLDSGVQFTWHFDESLRSVIGTGRFGVDNWREEGTGV